MKNITFEDDNIQSYELVSSFNNRPGKFMQPQSGKTFLNYYSNKVIHLDTVKPARGYLADHWCQKGHIVHCLEGEFISELENGEKFVLTKGMTYVVSDDLSSHRSSSENGVKLLIIDGDFLATNSNK